jgi:hypothetical protein
MSGGSLDYFYSRVRDIAETISAYQSPALPEHLAFAKHLNLVADALHDLEWVWSGDISPGDEMPALHKVISKADVLDAAVSQAETAAKNLNDALEKAKA